MTGPPAQRRDSRLAHYLEIAPAHAWIARTWLRTRIGGAFRRPGRSIHGPDQHPMPSAGEQPGLRHLVVVGDSLAAGVGDPVASLTLVGWADRLALALRQQCPQMGYSNLAVGGLTTSQIADGQLAAARALAPDLLILCAGGNDLLARRWDPAAFRGAYTALLAGLIGTGAAVITTTWHNLPLAVSMPAVLAQRYSRRLAEASAIVREVSAAEGSTCVDFWNLPDLLDAHCYSADGTHPNARGYLRVAQMFASAVARQTGIEVADSALYQGSERGPAPAPRPSWATRLWAYLAHGQGARFACVRPAPGRGRPRSQVHAYCKRLAGLGARFGAVRREVEA
jgi:lysophospholipase L1-like esterase